MTLMLLLLVRAGCFGLSRIKYFFIWFQQKVGLRAGLEIWRGPLTGSVGHVIIAPLRISFDLTVPKLPETTLYMGKAIH